MSCSRRCPCGSWALMGLLRVSTEAVSSRPRQNSSWGWKTEASFRRHSVLGRVAGTLSLSLYVFGHLRVLREIWDVYTEMKDVGINSRIWSWVHCFQETSIFFHTNEKTRLGSAACDIFRMAFSRFLRFYFLFIIFMLTSVTEKVA